MCSCCFQLEEELSGVVEIIGTVSNKGVVMAYTYNMLREDKGIPFGGCRPLLAPGLLLIVALTDLVMLVSADLELYNEALKVIHDFPQHYPFEVAASG